MKTTYKRYKEDVAKVKDILDETFNDYIVLARTEFDKERGAFLSLTKIFDKDRLVELFLRLFEQERTIKAGIELAIMMHDMKEDLDKIRKNKSDE